MEHLFKLHKDRNARVFVSSTFRDMMDEREHLVKDVFPSLREKLSAKGVSFAEVDLRWGISEQDALDGKVVEICLDEIDQSRPYFIGIIGDRYGWVPADSEHDIFNRLKQRFPWAIDDIKEGLSITEMEIQYGVIRNPDMHGRSFFYIKANHEDQADSSPDAEKLRLLKKKLIESKGINTREYNDINHLGQMVYDDLGRLLENDFPEEADEKPLARINRDQNAFLNNRLRNYVLQEDVFEAFSEKVALSFNPVLLSGQEGLGKTSLMANWIDKLHRENPRRPILYRFPGASVELQQPQALVRNLCSEIIQYFDFQFEIPKDTSALYALFHKLLESIDPQKELIVVIDGLDDLSLGQNEAPFQWLPDSLAPNVKIVVSLNNGPLCEVFRLKGYDFFEIQNLRIEGIRDFVTRYLAFFGKTVDKEMMDLILGSALSSNPMMLKSMLEEVRMYGSFESLKEFSSRYALCTDCPSFFNTLLDRLQDDVDSKIKGLTAVLLSLIRLSKNGLSESELLSLGAAWYKQGYKIPHLFWSPVLASCSLFFNRRNGYISIANKDLINVIDSRFLDDENARLYYHQIMAAWFSLQPLEKRSMDELPFHLEGSGNWEGLYQYLSLPAVFKYLFINHLFSLADLWNKLSSRYSFADTYLLWLDEFESGLFEPAEKGAYLALAGNLAFFAGLKSDAAKVLEPALEIMKSAKGLAHPDTISVTKLLAGIWQDLSEPEKSLALLQAIQEKIEAEDPENPELIGIQSMQADVFQFLGQYDKAAELYAQSIDKLISSEIADGNELIDSINNLGHLYYKRAKYQQAEDLYLKALNHSILKYGDFHHFTAAIYLNLGELFRHTCQWDKSLSHTEKALEIREKIFGSTHPSTANLYNNISMLYYDMGQLDKALSFALKALEIRTAYLGPHHPQTLTVINNLASVFRKMGDWDKAIEYQKQALEGRMAVFSENHPAVSYTLNQLAVLYLEKKEFDKARPLLEKAYQNQIDNPGINHPDTLSTMSNLSLCYEQENQIDKAIAILEKANEAWLMSEAAYTPSHYEFLNNFAISLFNHDKTDELQAHLLKLLGFWQKAKVKDQGLFARTVEIMGAMQNAATSVEQMSGLWEKATETAGLLFPKVHPIKRTILKNHAAFLSETGHIGESIRLLEMIASEMSPSDNENYEWTNIQINLGENYSRAGRYDEAEAVFHKMIEMKQDNDSFAMRNAYVAKPFAEHKMRYRRYEEAQEILNEALDLLNTLNEPVPAATSRIFGLLGECFIETRNYKDAITVLEIALEDYGKFAERDGLVSAKYYHFLGQASYQTKDYKRADYWLNKALEVYENMLNENHPIILDVCYDLAWNLYSLGDIEQACQLHDGILNKRLEILGDKHQKSHESLFSIARLIHSAGDIEKASQVMVHIIDLRIKADLFVNDFTLRMLNFITAILMESDNKEKAVIFAEQAYLLCLELYGKEDKETIELHHKYQSLK